VIMKSVMTGALGAALLLGIGSTSVAEPFQPIGAASVSEGRAQGTSTPRIENGVFEAAVSAEQLSRISIIGDRVVSVRSLQDPEGPQMLVEAEDATGDVYVGFDGPALGRTFSLFLVTASGRTVHANLNVSAIPGQTIQVAGGGALGDSGTSVERTERRSDYMESVTAMMRVMFRGDSPEGVRCIERSSAAREVGGYSMRAVRTCEAMGLRGQVVVLENRSKTTAPVLVDQCLVAGVLAVGADRDEVMPGATARIFLVEENR